MLIFISIAEFHIHIKEKACNFEVYYSIGSIISKSFHVKIDRRHLATTNKKKKFVKRLPHFERKCREVVSRLRISKKKFGVCDKNIFPQHETANNSHFCLHLYDEL